MRLQAWTHQDYFALGKAIFRSVTGVVYPFAERTTQRAVLMVQSFFAADANIASLRAVKSGNFDNLKGMLLRRKALENETVPNNPAPAIVYGYFRPIGGSWPVDISVPGNTIFMRKATATTSEVVFRTEAAALIPAHAAQSNLVYGVCVETGEIGNGIPSGTALSLRNQLVGVADFFTSTESGGGAEAESEVSIRARSRENRKGHGEATWLGIERLLKTVEISGGHRVTHARLFEAFEGGHDVTVPPSPVGVVYAVIDDGSGIAANVGALDTTTYAVGGAAWWNYSSIGSELYIYLPKHALAVWVDGVTGALERNDGGGYVALTYGTDFWIDVDQGKIVLAFPLTVGQKIRAQFQFYGGLMEECAKRLTGVPDDPTNRGWRPLGFSIRVRPIFSVTNPTASASLTFTSGYDSSYGRQKAATDVASYLNSLNIGNSAQYLKISGILHKLPGIDTVGDLLLNGGVTDVGPTHSYGVVRGRGALSF